MAAVNPQAPRIRLEAALHALRACLPPGFAAMGALADEGLPIPAADRALVDRAVPHRRAEFVAGRWCAHQALAAVGLPAATLPTGLLGAPAWPAGAIGSITHDAGHCLAVAGPATALRGIGIDWCDDSRLDSLGGLADQVLSPLERDAFERAAAPHRHLQRVFCAKEAAVKAVSATIGRFIELQEITIEDDRAEAGGFLARIAGQARLIRGRHLPAQACALAWAALAA